MDENHKNNLSKIKLIKTYEKITSNSKIKTSTFSLFKKLLNIFSFFANIFSYFINKINYCLSKCSIIIQFPIILIPISIIIIIFIFLIHIYFYSNLYAFNFSKAFKDEFLDLYITKIDDLKVDLTSLVVKETKIDIENQLFFQIYFNELSIAGLMNQSKNFFPKFSDNPGSTSLFSNLNNIKNTDSNFEIPDDPKLNRMESRLNDKLGDFAKIYYYMFPHIWYGALLANTLINQSFFIAYEARDTITYDYYTWEPKEIKGILESFLFFRYPKEINKLSMTNNFTPNEYLLNPFSDFNETINEFYRNDNYFIGINWFKGFDFDFRNSMNNTEYDLVTNISLAHLNQESDGDINKTFITFAQQYIRKDDREFIINIIFIRMEF